MCKRYLLVGVALVLASPGFAEVVMTPLGKKPVGSDVVVESAVREIKSIPEDTSNLVGDAVMVVADEVSAAGRAVASVFYGSEREEAAADGIMEVAAAWDPSGELHSRSYTVSDELGGLLLNAAGGAEGAAIDVSSFFGAVEFSEGSSAYYMPQIKRLVVRQTVVNLTEMEYEMAQYRSVKRELLGHQVEIEVKFVEVSQGTLDELGFSWTFNDKNGGAFQLMDDLFLPAGTSLLGDGLRTASAALNAPGAGALGVRKVSGSLSWDLVINALEQADDTEVLSAPRIVTLDGKAATIEVGEERQVPQSFIVDRPNTSVFIEHADWELELMGVSLEVTPELKSSGMIRLELHPKVVDLIGYDSYQITPDNTVVWPMAGASWTGARAGGLYPVFSRTADGALNSVGKLYNNILDATTPGDQNDVNGWASNAANSPNYGYADRNRMFDKEELLPVPTVRGELPYFRVREIETAVTVADGSTVGMGGLIYDKNETFTDKVPVLGSIPLIGRLFRSEGERSIKRNLMIFVTATQVDVNGRRVADLNVAN